MSIEERARLNLQYEKDFLGHNLSEDMVCRAYIAGANWMLEEAADWIIDNVVFDKFGRSINIENFRKSMEE